MVRWYQQVNAIKFISL